MEKTKFKLNYIHAHVKKARHFTQKKRSNNQTHYSPTSKNSNISIYSPTDIFRVNNGLFCFLDQVPALSGYVNFLSLMLNFMQIKEIRIQNNFFVCVVEDIGEPCAEKAIIMDKMMTSANPDSSNLALGIIKYWDNYQEWELKGRRDLFIKLDQFDLLNKSTEPLLIYHHKKNVHHTISKIRMNSFMKEFTMKNEFELFNEGLLLIPCDEYFIFMMDFLDGCFLEKSHIFHFHLNAAQGVHKVYAYLYQIEWENEPLTIFYFPKSEQNASVQKLYDLTNERIKELHEMKKPKELPKKIQDIEDWNQIIKRYFETWLVKESKKVCTYKILD